MDLKIQVQKYNYFNIILMSVENKLFKNIPSVEKREWCFIWEINEII